MKIGLGAILGGILVLAVLASLSLFTVDQREHAIVLQFGEIREVITEPGLAVQVAADPERALLRQADPDDRRSGHRTLRHVGEEEPAGRCVPEVEDQDVRQYYISLSGDEARARSRLTQIVNSALREEIGERSVHEVVSGEREKIMQDVREKVAADSKGFRHPDRRCAAEARRAAAGCERGGLSADGSRTHGPSRVSCAPSAPPMRRRSAPRAIRIAK